MNYLTLELEIFEIPVCLDVLSVIVMFADILGTLVDLEDFLGLPRNYYYVFVTFVDSGFFSSS